MDDTLEHFRLNAGSFLLTFKDCKDDAGRDKGASSECKDIQQERKYDQAQEKILFDQMPKLNKEQQQVFDDVMKCVESREPSFKNVFYVDGPAGTGKTFLYKK